VLAPRPNPLQDLAAAFVLLTRLPIPWRFVSNNPPDLNSSVWAFPVVGAVVGGVGALGYGLFLSLGLSAVISAVLAIGVMVLLTGAYHEDGLADVADGFGGGQTVERKLEIMRDSRIGAYGMIAIVLVMALRIGGLSELSAEQSITALLVGGILSRLMVVFVMHVMPPARTDGLAYDTGRPNFGRFFFGATMAVGATIWLTDSMLGLYVTGVAVVSCVIMGWISERQVGGYTGDVLGAVQQVSDIAVLLFLLTYWGAG